jgi:hypothetical protein
MSRRRLRRRSEKAQRHDAADQRAASAEVVRQATRIERLAYTRTQAAEALGVSRSTFDRRVLPLIETIEMPWGTRMIPADELERLLAERRRAPRLKAAPPARPGRPRVVPTHVVERIRAEHAAGSTLGEIARGLSADGVPTAHDGATWWPSTVRGVLGRSPIASAKTAGERRSSG